jgi:plasmid stabilization system protein ParE
MHEFWPQAQQELLDATQWYLTDAGPAVAEEFEWAVQRALRLLAFMPRLGRPSYPGVPFRVIALEQCAGDAQALFPFPAFVGLECAAIARATRRRPNKVPRNRLSIDDARQQPLDGGFEQPVVRPPAESGFDDIPGCRGTDEVSVLAEVLMPRHRGVPGFDAFKEFGALQFAVVRDGHAALHTARGIQCHDNDIGARVEL